MADVMGLQGAYGIDSLQQNVRQQIADRIAEQERQRKAAMDQQEMQLRIQEAQQRGELQRAQLMSLQEVRDQQNQDRQTASVMGQYGRHLPGDIIDAIAPAVQKIDPSLVQSFPPNQPTLSMNQVEQAPQGPIQPSAFNAPQHSYAVGLPAQREDEQRKQLVGRLMANPNLTPLQRLAFEAENSGLKVPASGFEPKATATPANEIKDTAGGLMAVDPRTLKTQPILGPDNQPLKGYHTLPQPIVIQGPTGPMLGDRGSGTAKPFTDANGNPIGTKPSAQVETQRQNATNVRAHIADIQQQAQQLDKLGLLGPVGGRWADFLAGKIGSADLVANPQQQELLDEFRANVGLLKSGMAMVHGGARGGGSPAIMARMDALINANKMNLPLFTGSLRAFDKWLQQYEGKGGAQSGTSPSAAPDIYQEYLNRTKKPGG